MSGNSKQEAGHVPKTDTTENQPIPIIRVKSTRNLCYSKRQLKARRKNITRLWYRLPSLPTKPYLNSPTHFIRMETKKSNSAHRGLSHMAHSSFRSSERPHLSSSGPKKLPVWRSGMGYLLYLQLMDFIYSDHKDSYQMAHPSTSGFVSSSPLKEEISEYTQSNSADLRSSKILHSSSSGSKKPPVWPSGYFIKEEISDNTQPNSPELGSVCQSGSYTKKKDSMATTQNLTDIRIFKIVPLLPQRYLKPNFYENRKPPFQCYACEIEFPSAGKQREHFQLGIHKIPINKLF